MERMFAWAFPLLTLSLSRLTSSSSGPSGGISGSAHHDLTGNNITKFHLGAPAADHITDTLKGDVNVPKANEELVLQQDGEDEEDEAFSCHCKQVLPDGVPLERVQGLLRAWRSRATESFTGIFIDSPSCESNKHADNRMRHEGPAKQQDTNYCILIYIINKLHY